MGKKFAHTFAKTTDSFYSWHIAKLLTARLMLIHSLKSRMMLNML